MISLCAQDPPFFFSAYAYRVLIWCDPTACGVPDPHRQGDRVIGQRGLALVRHGRRPDHRRHPTDGPDAVRDAVLRRRGILA